MTCLCVYVCVFLLPSNHRGCVVFKGQSFLSNSKQTRQAEKLSGDLRKEAKGEADTELWERVQISAISLVGGDVKVMVSGFVAWCDVRCEIDVFCVGC
jgi:hypothetical protein